MNTRTLRRIAADHSKLRNQPLPPNYLFPSAAPDTDDLTQLDILLAGPTHTPFANGVWKLHLAIPSTYPQQPPTANFRTSIFHPNVDPQTGAVCVETLKRDWDSKLTLRDVLITISCLLIQPNPDSALNADAGALIQEEYQAFARRAELMTSIQAVVPKALQAAVKEAQMRGQDPVPEHDVQSSEALGSFTVVNERRRAMKRPLPTSDGSPVGPRTRRREQEAQRNPFTKQSPGDDVFGELHGLLPEGPLAPSRGGDDNSSLVMEATQENDESLPLVKTRPEKFVASQWPSEAPAPRRRPVRRDPPDDSDQDTSMEAEYPPSPKKYSSSPSKTPSKRKPPTRPESSRDAARRGPPNITPPNHPDAQPLARHSPFAATTAADPTPSPRKAAPSSQPRPSTRPRAKATPHLIPKRAPLFPSLADEPPRNKIFQPQSPSSVEKRATQRKKRADMDARLWEACGRDVGRWNRGDFGRHSFPLKAKRW